MRPVEGARRSAAAASVISTIPAVLLMFAGQRFIVSGLTLGAVK